VAGGEFPQTGNLSLATTHVLFEVFMSLRITVIALAAMLAITTACTNKKVSNPLAKVDSKQPDKILFDRGMDAMKHNQFDVSRLDMQTLINTYPDSEFIARAKLALADSWYAEGGSAALAQAEQEYRDFETFFPNMPEAAEAQLKIANIHFQQMEKPDRDFTHAVRAEQEYRKVILQYPDNPKMVAEAKKRLMEVQEVIAEREFRVGRFYYLRQSYPAAIARLESLVERYPLYSKADEALYLIGQSYEGEVSLANRSEILSKEKHLTEAQRKNVDLQRERYMTDAIARAAEAYDRVLTRYPVMQYSDAAKARLEALKQPIPRPTRAMLAQNAAEENARHEESTMASIMGAFSKHPDVNEATTVGQPTLQDLPLVDARELQEAASRVIAGQAAKNSVEAQAFRTGSPGENQPAPTSDNPAQPSATAPATTTPEAADDPNELKPTANATAAASDPNELVPNVPQDPQPAAAPPQVNEIAQGTSGGGAKPAASASKGSGQELATDEMIASSKHKKKKGLHKILPFQ
jgi:outer membrane protein assembly factor BamD